MVDVNEILRKYTSGEMSLEEANSALEETGASFHLDPERNMLTEKETELTFAGWEPEEANGWGLLDTGTGTLDKVKVVDGRLDYAVNQILEDGSTNMPAYVTIGGKRYEVKGDKLAEITPRQPAKRTKRPRTPDLRRRTDLAGQTVTQHTLSGDYNVTYDEHGYAAWSVRVDQEDCEEE